MKKTLGIIIDTALLIPPNTGVTYRLYYLSKAIAAHGMNVKIFICNRNIFNNADVKGLFDDSNIEFHIIPENVFYNVSKMTEIIRENKVDLLQFEDHNTLLYFDRLIVDLKLKTCLEIHDIEATLKEYFKFNDREINTSNKLTILGCRIADLIICMTPYDRKQLAQMGVDKRKIKLIPNPIDLDQFPYLGPNIKNNNLIFIGNMHYWPNQKAAQYIIDDIYPNLKQKIKNLKIYFIGMAPDDLRAKYRHDSRLKFTGSVDNLSKYLKLGTIALCPITEGSGMKVKILNYSAAGLPIVTMPLGVSGYEKIKSLIILDKLADFPYAIIKLFNQPNKIISIGKQNRQYVAEYYEINDYAKKIIRLYKSNIARGFSGRRRICLKKIPTLLWLKENRVKKNNNANYYIAYRGKMKIINLK